MRQLASHQYFCVIAVLSQHVNSVLKQSQKVLRLSKRRGRGKKAPNTRRLSPGNLCDFRPMNTLDTDLVLAIQKDSSETID